MVRCLDRAIVSDGSVLLADRRSRAHAQTRAACVQEAIFAVVAAVLHLGNCDFVEDPDTDGGCKLADAFAERHLAWAAELLCVDGQGLLHALSTRTRQTPEGPIISPISAEAALSNRDSLAKTIYARLFDWLVLQVRPTHPTSRTGCI